MRCQKSEGRPCRCCVNAKKLHTDAVRTITKLLYLSSKMGPEFEANWRAYLGDAGIYRIARQVLDGESLPPLDDCLPGHIDNQIEE
jgi:hypothetical protein